MQTLDTLAIRNGVTSEIDVRDKLRLTFFPFFSEKEGGRCSKQNTTRGIRGIRRCPARPRADWTVPRSPPEAVQEKGSPEEKVVQTLFQGALSAPIREKIKQEVPSLRAQKCPRDQNRETEESKRLKGKKKNLLRNRWRGQPSRGLAEWGEEEIRRGAPGSNSATWIQGHEKNVRCLPAEVKGSHQSKTKVRIRGFTTKQRHGAPWYTLSSPDVIHTSGGS